MSDQPTDPYDGLSERERYRAGICEYCCEKADDLEFVSNGIDLGRQVLCGKCRRGAGLELVEPLVTLPSGSTRSADVPPDAAYDLIPHGPLLRLARRYGQGAAVHGDRNWEMGQPLRVVVAHMVSHLFRWLGGDRTDDHLAAVAWGCFALMFFEDELPECLAPVDQFSPEKVCE